MVKERYQRLTLGHCMVGAFAIGALLVVMSRLLSSVPGTDLGTTARWSFILFWLGTTGGAMARLFGRKFEALARRGRDLSLCYAAAHLAHLAIVVRLLFTQTRPASELLFFGTAVFCTYLLALFSVANLSKRLNPTVWRFMRVICVEFIALAFLVDFNKNPFDGGFFKVCYYLPFLALAVSAPVLRLAAYLKRSAGQKRASPVAPV